MSDPIEKGQKFVEEKIREEAKEQGVELGGRRWWSEAGRVTPETYNLEVWNVDNWHEENDFTRGELLGYETDNQMKVRVMAKVVGIVLQLKKHSE